MDNLKQTDEAKAEPIAHGDAENGFIVEHHDGEMHRTHGCTAGSADEAISDAKRKWADDDAASGEGQDGGGASDDHADAKRLNRAEVDAMLEERDEKIADLENRLADHDRKFEAIHDALAEMAKPAADALDGVEEAGGKSASA